MVMKEQMNNTKKRGILIATCLAIVVIISLIAVFVYNRTKINAGAADVPVPEGITPVTWDVSEDHLMIESDEARALYERIKANDYPTLDELVNDPVVKELDALSAYYGQLYGDTSTIDTPEREQLRADVLKQFLSHGSAREVSVSDDGRKSYEYDGPLAYEYKAVIVLGLPASGKSTIADPYSEELSAFNFDSDLIKEMLPEYQESHGAAASSVHQESRNIQDMAVREFLEGDMKGCNVIIQTIGNDLDAIHRRYIDPFEDAGYNVKIVLVPAEVNESLARAVMRGLRTGRIIPSSSIIGYGKDPENVYNTLAKQLNSCGEPYAYQE